MKDDPDHRFLSQSVPVLSMINTISENWIFKYLNIPSPAARKTSVKLVFFSRESTSKRLHVSKALDNWDVILSSCFYVIFCHTHVNGEEGYTAETVWLC